MDRSARGWGAARVFLGLVFVVVFVQQVASKGFPFDRERLLLWLTAALAVTGVGRPIRRIGQLLLDWVPFAVLLIIYDISRGLAGRIRIRVVERAPIAIDKMIFGGRVPTVWLQSHLAPKGTHISWWEVGVALVYASHFVVSFVAAAFLWARSRREWRRFVNRFFLLNIGGLITYCFLPVAPPWYAAADGYLPPLTRSVGRGWGRIGFGAATQLLHEGRIALNSAAAVPSLHAGYSMLFVAYLWSRVSFAPLRWLMLAYPLAMAFSLVYGAEHYVIDVLIGWLYVWFAFRAARRLEAWWPRYKQERSKGKSWTLQ